MTDVRRIVSENRRAVWVITAALLVNVGLYALVVYPLSQRVATEQQQAGDATRSLNEARRALNGARGTVSGKQQADEELLKFYRDVLPADQSAARRIFYPKLDQLARDANLSMRSRIDAEPRAATGLNKLTMTLMLEGEYTNVRHFIHELETAPEFLVLESVTVTQGSQEEQHLNVTARIATYYRSEARGD
jgi:hypothetical protein